MRRTLLCLLLGGLLWGASLAALAQHGSHRQEDRTRFIAPPLEAIRPVVTDFENLLADSYWLLFLQMNGENLQIEDFTQRDYTHVYPTLDLIVGLDPNFHEAVLFGSWVLADGEKLDEALKLVAEGQANHPEDYRYPYQRGFLEFLYGKRYLEAAKWFEVAAALPGAPPGVARFAASMYQRGSKTELAIRTWRTIRETSQDRHSRAIAERALRKLGVQP